MGDSEAAGATRGSKWLKEKKAPAASSAAADPKNDASDARRGKASSSTRNPQQTCAEPKSAERSKKASVLRAKPSGTSPSAAAIVAARPTNIPEPAGVHAKTVVKLEVADEILSSPEKPPRDHPKLAAALAE